MTIKQLVQNASQNIDHLDAEVLLAHVLKKPREFLISHDTDSVGFLNTRKFKKLVKKRAQNYPAAQLIGMKGFFGYDFEVNKHTLIPRPDTEMIVELGIQEIKKTKRPVTLIDVGTGSGCIPISISKKIAGYGLQVTGYATDISQGALKVAKRNAKKHNVQIDFKQGNLLEPLLDTCQPEYLSNCQLLITANLPYLTNEQFTTEPSIQHEPKSALVAEDDGLALYEGLFEQVKSLLLVPCVLLLEFDPTQSERMSKLIQSKFPDAPFEIKKDLAGLDRVVSISL